MSMQSRISTASSSAQQHSQQQMKEVRDWAQHQIEEQPMAVVCAAFAAGLVVGVGIISAYCAAESESTSRQMERYGSRLADSVMRSLPPQLAQVFRN